MTTTIEQVRARLRAGDLDRLANTVRTPGHPLRASAASLLAALAGSPRRRPALRAPAAPALPAGARRLTVSEASALAARARAEAEAADAAWDRWAEETFAHSTDTGRVP